MSTELLTGTAAAGAASEADFAGMTSPRRYRIDPRLADQADRLLEAAFTGQWGADVRLAEAFTKPISEAFSTSDFKLAAFAVIDTEMLRRYTEATPVWSQYCDQTLVNDFRPKRLVVDSLDYDSYDRVPEGTEYPIAAATNRAPYGISVAKYGRRKAVTWEAWKNNEAIDELGNLPEKLARAAVATEDLNGVSNLLKLDPATKTASNVNTAFFKAANGNAPTSLPLTRDNLKAVIDGMAVKTDPVTERIVARPDVVVVVPKALEQTMIAIVAPRTIRTEVVSGSTTTVTEIDNPVAGVAYVVEPMLDYTNKHAKAATTWFVLPKPGSARPAMWTAKLRGYEAPDLRVKADGGQRIGGGMVSPLEGSFEIDDIQFRGRHIVGAQTADPLFTYVSYGS